MVIGTVPPSRKKVEMMKTKCEHFQHESAGVRQVCWTLSSPKASQILDKHMDFSGYKKYVSCLMNLKTRVEEVYMWHLLSYRSGFFWTPPPKRLGTYIHSCFERPRPRGVCKG